MILEAIIIGIIIGYLKKGKLSRLKYLEIHLKPLLILSAISLLVIIVMNLGLFDFDSRIFTILFVLTYALTIIVIVFNLDKKYMFMPLIGGMSNFICLCVNHFKFPVKSSHIILAYGEEFNNLLLNNKIKFYIADDNALFKMLGKIFYLGDYYFYDVILSIGDIIIAIGIILIIQALMTDKSLKSNSTIILSKSLFKKKR